MIGAVRALAAALALPVMMMGAGCAQLKMGAPVPSIDNIAKARATGMPPVALGSFALAPGKDPALDQKLVVRTNTVYSPYGSSFAAYLKQTFATDLGAAGLLDPRSPTVIEALLTDSSLDVPNGPAQATVAARIAVIRAGSKLYEKDLRASESWTASFLGVEAISRGVGEYGLLHRKLLAQLLDDPAFIAAVRGPR